MVRIELECRCRFSLSFHKVSPSISIHLAVIISISIQQYTSKTISIKSFVGIFHSKKKKNVLYGMVDAIRQGVAHIFDLFELASASASAANNRKFHYCLYSKQKKKCRCNHSIYSAHFFIFLCAPINFCQVLQLRVGLATCARNCYVTVTA